jgi:hypothetical protein
MTAAVVKLIGGDDRRADGRDTEPQLPAPDSGHYEVASDRGGANWAINDSLIETAKLNSVNPLTKLVNRWPASRIDKLMPWNYEKAADHTVNV